MSSAPTPEKSNVQSQAEIAKPVDKAQEAAEQNLSKYSGRVNLLTGKTNLPAELISLTRMRLQSEALIATLEQTEKTSFEMDDFSRNTIDGIPIPPDMLKCYQGIAQLNAGDIVDGEANRKFIQTECLYDTVSLMGLHKMWSVVADDIDSGDWMRRVAVVNDYVKARKAMFESFNDVNWCATSLRLLDWNLRRMMYPETPNDVRFMLHVCDVADVESKCTRTNTVTGCPKCIVDDELHKPIALNQTTIQLPALGLHADDEICPICTERDITKRYVHITPRCVRHRRCVTFRNADTQCKCKNKYFHLGCLAQDMSAQLNGSRNDGVGKMSLMCPLCRGSYCYMDLTVFRIIASSDEQQSLKRPASTLGDTRKSRRTQSAVEETEKTDK